MILIKYKKCLNFNPKMSPLYQDQLISIRTARVGTNQTKVSPRTSSTQLLSRGDEETCPVIQLSLDRYRRWEKSAT